MSNSFRRFNVLAAGARFGKSMLAGALIAREVLKLDRRIWVVAPTYQLAQKEFSWALEFLTKAGYGPDRAVRFSSPTSGSAHIEFPWKSWITTKSADHPASLLGEELDLLVMAEGANISERVWERFLRARLGSRKGSLLIPSTPAGDNWIHELWKRGQNQTEWPEWASWQFSVLENPYYDKEEYETAKRELGPTVFAEQFDGQFIAAHGKVYKEFDRLKHVITEMPQGWQSWWVIRCVDFGFTNPFACLLIAISPDAHYYVFKELYGTQRICEDWAPDIKAASSGLRIYTTVCDHDAEDRATLDRHGIANTAAVKNLPLFVGLGANRGIRASISMMKSVISSGRVHVMNTCKHTLDEFDRYVYPESNEEKYKAESEVPCERNNHALDALRYGVFYWEWQNRRNFWANLFGGAS